MPTQIVVRASDAGSARSGSVLNKLSSDRLASIIAVGL
jgi:hypothetical protein